MKNLIFGARQTGKTTKLIKLSALTGQYIVCANRMMVDNIVKMAKEMELSIPFPVTIAELMEGNRGRGSSMERDGVLMDQIEMCMQQILRVPINTVTITSGQNSIHME